MTALRLSSPSRRYPDPPLAEYTLQLSTGLPTAGRFDLGAGRFSVLAVALPEAMVVAAAEACGLAPGRGLDATHDRGHADPTVAHLAGFLCLDEGNVLLDDPLCVDTVAGAPVARLLGLSETLARSGGEPRATHRLSRTETARLVAFVDACLDRPLSVAALAAALDRPEATLSAVFKASFGVTP